MMTKKLPTPVCTAFLPCRRIVHIANDSQAKDVQLTGLPVSYSHYTFPSAIPIGFYMRCTSGHGSYSVEVQLQNLSGEVIWKEGPPEPWQMPDPLETYNLAFLRAVIFPAPGTYQFVLLLAGQEVSRQRFNAKLVAAKKQSDV
jgi:hypothetical protein